jgi:hypothetical protein
MKMKIFLIVPFVLLLSTVLIVCSGLPNKTVIGKYFWFYSTMVLASLTVFLNSLIEKKSFNFFLQDALTVIFYVLGLVIMWLNVSTLSNKWVVLLLLLPLYFSFRYMLQDNNHGSIFLLFFMMITGFVEALWGGGQLYGFSQSYNDLYEITGSFFNPGPYAGYLATIIPLSVYYCISDCHVFNRKWDRRYIIFYIRGGFSSLTFVSIAIILPSTMSRAAWIAAICGCIYIFVVNYHRKKKYTFLRKSVDLQKLSVFLQYVSCSLEHIISKKIQQTAGC